MSPQQAKRGRPSSFDLDELLDAAVAVIDTAGLERCTLRTVAAELGVTAMALYRYVNSKDELLALIPDHLVDRRQRPFPATGDGIDALQHVADAVIDVLEAHPAASPLFMRPAIGPTMTAIANTCIDRLVEDGYSPGRAAGLLRATVALVIGLTATGGTAAEADLGPVAEDVLQLWLTGVRHTPRS